MLYKLPGPHNSASLHARTRTNLTFSDNVLHLDRSVLRACRWRTWVCRGCGGCSKGGPRAELDAAELAGGNNTGMGSFLSFCTGCSWSTPLASDTWMFATRGIWLGFLQLLPFDGERRWCGRFLGTRLPLHSPPPVPPIAIVPEVF